MLTRIMKDYKIICCAGKTMRCLEVMKKVVCCAVFAFAAYESVMMIKKK